MHLKHALQKAMTHIHIRGVSRDEACVCGGGGGGGSGDSQNFIFMEIVDIFAELWIALFFTSYFQNF